MAPSATRPSLLVLTIGSLIAAVGILSSGLGQQAPGDPDQVAKLIASHLKARKGLALDVGCGAGRLALALARETELLIECVEAD